jgi:hypothetical protein
MGIPDLFNPKNTLVTPYMQTVDEYDNDRVVALGNVFITFHLINYINICQVLYPHLSLGM